MNLGHPVYLRSSQSSHDNLLCNGRCSTDFCYLYGFFKVIPPPEWSPESIEASDDHELTELVHQKARKVKFGGIDLGLTTDLEPMTLGQYAKLVKTRERQISNGMSINDIEDIYWRKICTSKSLYAANQNRSLFGDNVQTWNLDKLTKAHSSIHGTKMHHNENCRTKWYSKSGNSMKSMAYPSVKLRSLRPL